MEATLASGNKRRVLPSWMTVQGAAKSPKRRRKVGVLAAAATARPSPVRTVYCMNEAELVNTALAVLIEDHKQEEPRKQPPLADADKSRLSPTCSVSPHTSSPGTSGEEEDSGKEGASPGLSPSQGPGASSSACGRSPGEDEEEEEEEDALKYVREIFFS